MEFSVTNIPFFLKTISPKMARKLFCFLGGCRHIYAYWLQFYEFLEIMSSVKSKSAFGCFPPSHHGEIENKSIA
jgi:hypothetical protein